MDPPARLGRRHPALGEVRERVRREGLPQGGLQAPDPG